ncbi:MAG: serine/threonine-protein kinase [Planctomycetota bacterium]
MDIQRGWQDKGKNVQLLAIFLKKGYLSKEQILELQRGPAPLPRTIPIEVADKITHYEFEEKIGEGGVASVFSAINPDGDRVAVKILFPCHAVNPVFVQRFFDEGKFLEELEHPNIVKGYGIGIWPDNYEELPPEERLHYMEMELVDGQSVQDDLNENGPMAEAKALRTITQIAEALAYLNSRNCVHRDIKPDNILYAFDGTIKLCDLGFAKEIEDAEAEGETEDTTCGTVQYISPEQARGFRDVDIRADIYSLGATLYHLVIGEVPFSGKDSMEIMAAQVLNSLESDKYRKRGLSPFIGYFIEKMMAKEREIRYQTPQEVVDDINQIIKGAADLIYNPDADPMVQKFGGKSGSGGGSKGKGRTGGPPRKPRRPGATGGNSSAQSPPGRPRVTPPPPRRPGAPGPGNSGSGNNAGGGAGGGSGRPLPNLKRPLGRRRGNR